jgi:hypothetical protein
VCVCVCVCVWLTFGLTSIKAVFLADLLCAWDGAVGGISCIILCLTRKKLLFGGKKRGQTSRQLTDHQGRTPSGPSRATDKVSAH